MLAWLNTLATVPSVPPTCTCKSRRDSSAPFVTVLIFASMRACSSIPPASSTKNDIPTPSPAPTAPAVSCFSTKPLTVPVVESLVALVMLPAAATVVAATCPPALYTTALLFTTDPTEAPSNKFISAALDLTKAPPSFSPFVPSCDAMSKSNAPSLIVTCPLASAVNALLASDVPSVVTSK